jgi:GNAT superfamily N-acetyltransferase
MERAVTEPDDRSNLDDVEKLFEPDAAAEVAWNESDHPRGQPENAGEFAPAGGGGSKKKSEASERSNKWAASGGTVKRIEDSFYRAYDKNGKMAGALVVDPHRTPKEVFKVAVDPEFRRRGVASAMYQQAEKDHGELTPSSALTDEGFEFWKGYRPESVKNDLRMHQKELMGAPVTSTYGEGTDAGEFVTKSMINFKTQLLRCKIVLVS